MRSSWGAGLVAVSLMAGIALACGGKATGPTTGSEPPAGSPAAEERCDPGGTWSDGCNTCSCADDGRTVQCTERACAPDASVCTPGTTKIEDCNTCTCDDGRWGCTLMGCGPTPTGAGRVLCARLPCDTKTSVCCDAAQPPAAPEELCVPNAGTLPCGAAEARHCDQAADCAAGEVCCGRPSSALALPVGTVCMPKGSCGNGPYDPQFCQASEECAPGVACIVQACRGRRIATCGGVPEKRCE